MAELKKFLFDNFIIGGRETKQPEPEVEIVEEENLPPVEEVEEVETVEENIPQEETFSQEDLELKATEADRAGYERGYEAARQEQIEENNRLLNDISQKLTVLLAQCEDTGKQYEQEAAKVLKQALQTLVPPLLEENAIAMVTKFLQDNFNNFKQNEKLSFYIHPDIISYIQDSIIKLAISNDFEGKIAIHKDSSLDKSSCRVEWDNGGVEYTPSGQLEQVEQMLEKQ